MPIPALVALLGRVAGEEILANLAGAAGKKAATGAAETAAAQAATKSARMSKIDKQVDSFNALFRDHPSHQPPPLPDRRPWLDKAKDLGQQYFKTALDRWKKQPIAMTTGALSKASQDLDSGKSIGQGIVDTLKKVDPTGLVALASAGLDFAGSVAARGLGVGKKVIQDDYIGLLGEVLPDAAMKVVKAFNELSNAIVERGRFLSRYNGQLAFSAAQADVRKINADIYESQTAGRSYSRVIDAQSKIETRLQRTFAPIKDQIADRVAFVLEKIDRLIELSGIEQTMAAIAEIGKVGSAFLSMDPEKIAQAIFDLPENVVDALFRKKNDDDNKKAAMEVIERAKADMNRGPQGAVTDRRGQGEDRFNFPAVRGG